MRNIFESFNRMKILVIGDVMIDAYLWGKVDRISPEAPVPILSFKYQEDRLGGAANVAVNLQALGATPLLCSVVGNDAYRKILNDLLQKANMENKGILFEEGRITTVKTRFISNSQQLLRVDHEDPACLNEDAERRFIARIQDLLKNEKIDGIIFEDYDKGAITNAVIEKTIASAREKNIPVFVDPKKKNFKNYRNITLFKPNFKEFCEGVNIQVAKSDHKGIYWAARFLHTTQKIEHVMVTLSEEGLFLSEPYKYIALPAKLREITDVSGAGDTVISVSTLCYIAGLEMAQAAAIGNIAAGQVCSKVGVVPVDKNALLEEVLAQKMEPKPRA